MTDQDKLKARLFEFLNSSDILLEAKGFPVMTREVARRTLQEIIRPTIEVKDVCERKIAVVCAAPHVSYDGWTHYFCNRTSAVLKSGRVIAKHFRDDNEFDIPASIGRHVHVNRPAESNSARGREHETDRAREAFELYVRSLKEAAGNKLPLDLLIEFHGHRRHESIEIATTGISEGIATELHDRFHEERTRNANLPKLLIEPMHQVRFRAQAAKENGSLQSTITHAALHIELPRSLRENEAQRDVGWEALMPVLELAVNRIEFETR